MTEALLLPADLMAPVILPAITKISRAPVDQARDAVAATHRGSRPPRWTRGRYRRRAIVGCSMHLCDGPKSPRPPSFRSTEQSTLLDRHARPPPLGPTTTESMLSSTHIVARNPRTRAHRLSPPVLAVSPPPITLAQGSIVERNLRRAQPPQLRAGGLAAKTK
ncbi:hypothetical protein BHM03_00041539 [Ensete ventricosum]|nr:hypothetical protein BHM03_00041539 [Ensete ventricosum]